MSTFTDPKSAIKPEKEEVIPAEVTTDAETMPATEEAVMTVEQYVELYEQKFGKKPTGKWAKDVEWIKSKLAE